MIGNSKILCIWNNRNIKYPVLITSTKDMIEGNQYPLYDLFQLDQLCHNQCHSSHTLKYSLTFRNDLTLDQLYVVLDTIYTFLFYCFIRRSFYTTINQSIIIKLT